MKLLNIPAFPDQRWSGNGLIIALNFLIMILLNLQKKTNANFNIASGIYGICLPLLEEQFTKAAKIAITNTSESSYHPQGHIYMNLLMTDGDTLKNKGAQNPDPKTQAVRVPQVLKLYQYNPFA